MSNDHSNAYGTNLARAYAPALGLEPHAHGVHPDGNGFDGSRAGARIGPREGSTPFRPGVDHWGSVPDDERETLVAGFGAELFRLRKASGLSQARLGELAGLRGDHVGRLERGQRRPTVASIIALSRIVVPEAQREDVQSRLASLAGRSLREGAARKKHAKDNKRRRGALAAAERAQRQMKSALRDAERRGEVTSGSLRNLANRLGETVDQLRAEITPDQPEIKGVPTVESLKRRWDRPRSRSRKDLEAWLDSHRSVLSERFEDDDDDE